MNLRQVVQKNLIGGPVLAGAADAGLHLFEAGGKTLLTEEVKEVTAQVLGEVAKKLPGVVVKEGTKKLSSGAAQATGAVAQQGSKALAQGGLRIGLKALGRASAFGGAVGGGIDAGFASYDAVNGYRSGQMTGSQAWAHVGKEGGKGALAGVGSCLVTGGIVALVGGAAPVVLTVTVGMAAGYGIKKLLDSIF
ncbi:MAG: hypothetical protein M3Q75_09585 [Gemmatimonadota bacterium]|nr:hypothetical protein [Gemmatimonadota bacterium]